MTYDPHQYGGGWHPRHVPQYGRPAAPTPQQPWPAIEPTAFQPARYAPAPTTQPAYPVQPYQAPQGYYPAPPQQPYTIQQQFYPHPPYASVTTQPTRTNHVLHLLLTVLTCGLWFPVWLIVWVVNSSRTEQVHTRHY